jgi:hypothetical protein
VALTLSALALVGSALACLICSAATGICAWSLARKYRSDLRTAGVSEVPAHRDRLDVLVSWQATAAVGVGLAAGVIPLASSGEALDVDVPLATPVLVFVAAAAVYLSSLFDWYLILPRVSGLLGPRPCRPSSGEPSTFPDSWRETTRWWYVHRIAAALILRFSLAFAITIGIHDVVDIPLGPSIVAAAVLGVLANYLLGAWNAGWEAGHLSMSVGDTVRRLSTSGRPRRSVRLFKYTVEFSTKVEAVGSEETGEREYVYDVAVENVQLVPVEPYEATDLATPVMFEDRPIKIPTADASACEPADSFKGCEGRCSGINWYCIENPLCFKSKQASAHPGIADS